MKGLILAALLVAGCASADQSPSMGDILIGSAANTLSWATRDMSAQNAADAATVHLDPLVQSAVTPVTNAAAAGIDAAHEDFQHRLDNSRSE